MWWWVVEFAWVLKIVCAIMALGLQSLTIYNALTGHGTRKQLVGLAIGAILATLSLVLLALHPPTAVDVAKVEGLPQSRR